LIVQLYQNVNNIALALNAKVTGLYPLNTLNGASYTQQEFVNGKVFPSPDINNPNNTRSNFTQSYLVRNVGAGVTTIAHNLPITSAWTFTQAYGMANDTVGFRYLPIAFASAGGANNIELRVNATNIVLTNNSGISFNIVYLFVEYLKN